MSLELYDDATHTANTQVLRKQWFDETLGTFGALVCGKRVPCAAFCNEKPASPLSAIKSP